MRRALAACALMALAACSAPLPNTDAATPSASSGRAPDVAPDAMYVLPEAAGWNAQALAETVAYVKSQKTTGFLIIDDGRIVAEHNWPLPEDAAAFRANFTYGPAADGALLEDVASQQKSFIAFLAAIAADRKQLDISRPVSHYVGAGWSKASPEQEGAITVRHLLEMTSGLGEALDYLAPAGSVFFYNTPAYAILKPVLEEATGKSLDALTRDWLTAPLGMTDTAWRQRPAVFANSGNPTGLVTTPRDIARMGQLVLDRGRGPDKARLVSEREMDAIMSPTATNPAYGRLWWLNGGAYSHAPGANAPRSEGALIPAASADLVAAQGAQDRKLYVVPSRKLIVVRTGQATPDRDFNQQLWLRLARAMPKR